MNRQQRRKMGVDAKPKVYTLTDAQLNHIRKEAACAALKNHADQVMNDTLDDVFLLLMCIPVIVLGDKCGWRKVRNDRFLDEAVSWFEDVKTGAVTLEQIIEEAQKYCSYKFQRKVGERRGKTD